MPPNRANGTTTLMKYESINDSRGTTRSKPGTEPRQVPVKREKWGW
ncbi:4797_t:CDS:2, partial [Racocetra fulgida]